MSTDIADSVLAAWGACTPARLVAERENTVHQACLESGTRVALRLHRSGYRTEAAITAELDWTSALAARGIACPAPVRTLTDGWTSRASDGRLCSVVTWVDGAPILPDSERLHALGRVIALFHAAADTLADDPAGPTLAPFPRWDAAALLGEEPTWGRFWESPALQNAEQARLESARLALTERLTALQEPDIGLIHADLLPDNVLDDGETITLIDFDDCAVGYRAYDLASVLVTHTERADFAELQAALIDGYAAERGHDPQHAGTVALFTVIRALASCGWAASRTEPGDARRRAYAERALRLVARWSKGAL